MNKLDLLRIAENQDVEAYEESDFEEEKEKNSTLEYKKKYSEFYDDIKQKSKYIKEDW